MTKRGMQLRGQSSKNPAGGAKLVRWSRSSLHRQNMRPALWPQLTIVLLLLC